MNVAFNYGFWELWQLYHKVTFDGANRIIRVNEGVTELDIKKDLYSDWKEWVQSLSDNAVWPPAIRTVGGDPTVAGQTAGDIYFLINGWKLYIDLTKVRVTGVLFSDDFESAYYNYEGIIQYPAQVASLVTASQTSTSGSSAADVWNYSTRTLTQQIASDAPTVEEISQAVWGYITRTLTESGGTTPQEVWEYANRTLTSDAAPSAQEVATAVWSAPSRTLTDPALTAQEVWEYATRSLTSEEVAPTAEEVASAVWSAVTRTLTSDAAPSVEEVTAGVWSAVSRTLTSDLGPTAQQIWEYASRTLTSNPGPALADIADAVWDEPYADHDLDGTMGHLLNYSKQLQKSIWVNTEAGVNGDGSQENPYDNITSAIDRAEEDNIRTIYLIGNITLTRNFKNFYLIGIGVPEVDLNGQDVRNSHFTEVALKGSFVNGSNIVIRDSVLLNGAYLDGFIENSALGGNLICNPNSAVFMKDCASAIPGTSRPTISMNPAATSQLSVRGYNGGLTIFDCNQATDRVTVELAAGSLTFASSCTNGIMVARGIGKFVDETTGATVVNETVNQETVGQTVDITDIEAKILELWRLAGLDASNIASITDSTISVGGVTITIGQPDAATTTLTRS